MTLTQTAKLTKRLILFFVITLIAGVSIWLGYRYYYYNVYLPSIPPVEIKADLKFGILPKPDFFESSASATNFSYVLDTPTGDLPENLPKIMTVFYAPARSITLLDPDRSNDLAKRMGFTNGPGVISPTQFKYSDESGGELIIDLNSGNFKFKKSTTEESFANIAGTLPSTDDIAKNFKDFLTTNGLIKPQLQQGAYKAFYNQDSQRKSYSATVSLWPNDLDKFPIVTSLSKTGLIRATVVNARKDIDRYLSLTYINWSIDDKTTATYPIKTALQAFGDLKNGLGVLVLTPNTGQVSIRSVYLGYFETDNYNPYIEPVFVFEGKDFVAYVPAIVSDYLER
ncbi:hypothetical protein HY025_03205 [Candidatus Daviesbacteria bacterium]|nr:hypothetical protein [Candidatus Daviesbacteria bacterium]